MRKKIAIRKDKEGNKFYHYQTSAFKKFKKFANEEDMYNVYDNKDFFDNSNIINMNVKIKPELFDELKHLVKKGYHKIEIRQKEIWIRCLHEEETVDIMSDIEFDHMDEESIYYKNDEARVQRIEELTEKVKNEHFIRFEENLFEHNLKNEVVIKFNKKTNTFIFQVTKVFDNGKQNLYIHKMKNYLYKQVKRIISK